jgi:TetR/AcrR family transcriptional regulator
MKPNGLKDKRIKTSERILAAASSIFSEKGFAGARMDEIANRAGVNKATIYYHIGDKDALYAEVLHHVFKPTADRMAVNLRTGLGPEEKLVTFIRNFADMLDRHPHLSPVMLREVASGGQNFPDIIIRDLTHFFGVLQEILKEGLAQGVFVQTRPFVVHMMIVGTSLLYKATGPVRLRNPELPAQIKEMDQNVSGKIGDEIARLVLKAVKKENI